MRLNKRAVWSAATLAFAGSAVLTGSAITASASPSAGPGSGPALATSVHSSKGNEIVVCRGVLSGGGVFSATTGGGGSVPGSAGPVGGIVTSGGTGGVGGSVSVGSDGKASYEEHGSVSVGPDGKVTSGDVLGLPGVPAGAKAIGVVVGADGKVTSTDPNMIVREGSANECAPVAKIP